MDMTPRLLSLAVVFVFASPYVASSQSQPSPAPQGAAPKVATPTPAPTPTPTTGVPAAPPTSGPQLEPQGFNYDPAGRRDPFVSLVRRGTEVGRPTIGLGGARPAGLAGLEASEVTLKGTIASQGGYVGILQGSDTKTYIVKAGDKLLDGTIRTITQDSMVITQQVTDPLSLAKTREVRKVLRQTEEAK